MPYLSTTYDLPFNGTDTSRDAAKAASRFVGQQGLQVLVWFNVRDVDGGTQKECAEALNLGRPSVCARVRALELAGLLSKTSDRRGGCIVYRSVGGV